MTETTQIGYAKQKQYGDPRARRHSVIKNDRGHWVLLCTEKPGTREYKGWVTAVTCRDCKNKLGVEDDEL